MLLTLRLYFVALCTANKFLEDVPLMSVAFANLLGMPRPDSPLGITSREFLQMETEFLITLDWNLSVSDEECNMYLMELQKYASQSMDRLVSIAHDYNVSLVQGPIL